MKTETDYSKDFPLLQNYRVHGKRLVYLDNAATTQKPASVIDALSVYYEQFNANPHRGAYALSEAATEVYESARARVASFLNAASPDEIVFTRGTTEALNLAASSFGIDNINAGDEIVVSVEEHHSNLVPWQIVAKAKGATLNYLYINPEGELTEAEIDAKIKPGVKLVAVTLVSNVLGIVNPIDKIVSRARAAGAVVVLDIAQAVPHMPVDVRALDVDFAAFSGHKLFGPRGLGVLYAKKKHLDNMRPLLYGGGMVDDVSEQEAVFSQGPAGFEGGTQNVEGAAGLHAAIDYLTEVGFDTIGRIESGLTQYALERLLEIPYVTIYGTGGNSAQTAHSAGHGARAGIISFNIEGAHPHDVSTILDADGVAIRAGHHCAHPLMRRFGVSATCRASLCFYNTKEDIDVFVASIKKVRGWLGLEPK